MKHHPDDDRWINTENQELDPKIWWLTTFAAVVLVLICVGLIVICV